MNNKYHHRDVDLLTRSILSLLNGCQERDQVRSRRRAHADDDDERNEGVMNDFGVGGDVVYNFRDRSSNTGHYYVYLCVSLGATRSMRVCFKCSSRQTTLFGSFICECNVWNSPNFFVKKEETKGQGSPEIFLSDLFSSPEREEV